MICEKCKKEPMKMKGAYMAGMYLDWWECPKCDNDEDESMDKQINKIKKSETKALKDTKTLLKMDKKFDKKLDKCDKMMHKKKK
jgi:hypothetical protein